MRHILTARHVVDDAQDCQVRLDGDANYRLAKVMWRGLDNVDVIVLELVDERPSLDDRDPIWAGCRWVDGECRAAGYPAFLDFAEGPEREQFVGRLRPDSGIERGRIHAVGTWAENREPERWGGMSGAALFSGGYLIGVVTESMGDRLLACPVSKLFEDESFRQTFPEFRFDNTVLWPVADRPAVRQLRPQSKRRTGTLDRPPSELLLAHNEVVPFDDSLRARELARLESFSVDRGPAMLVFTGPGGAGKTRLMIEWCTRMRELGWLAGFVQSSPAELPRVTEGETPRLLVVDYPEGRVNDVAELCRRAHSAVASVRLVLLARSRGQWFDELRQEVDGDMVTSAHWQELDALDDAQRRRTYKQARAVFSMGPEQEDVSAAELARDEPPLFTHMRALLGVHGDREVDEKRDRVLARVLDHERKHWRAQLGRLLGSPPSKAMLWDLDRVLAAVVLFGGIEGPLGELLRWLRPELDQREREAFATCIAALYRRGTRVAPLQPDLLGEQLVFEAISHAIEQDGASGVEWWLCVPIDKRAPKGSIGQTLVVLTRLVDRQIESAREWLRIFVEAGYVRWIRACVDRREQADPRGHQLATAVVTLDDVELASRVDKKLPRLTVELLQLRVEVANVLLRHAPQDGSDDSRTEQARLLNKLGVCLSELGRREEALATTHKAVEIQRELAKGRPDEFLPKLAMALNNLGAMLSVLGRREEALATTLETVEYYRELAKGRPDAFLPALAMALNNLGAMLSELGRREEAMATTLEAAEYYRELAKGEPDAFLPDLAMALSNLGGMLSALGRREEALAVTRKAVEHYRELAKRRPDAFLPNLAAALNNLGIDLSESGWREEALAVTQEAVEIRRELAKERPDTFLPDLAMALNNLGLRLGELGRREEAVATTHEAVEYYRELAKERPDAFLPNLAAALSNLGARLNALGRREEALATTQEAVARIRELAKGRPDAFLPELARALVFLGMAQRDHAAHEESIASLAEGLRILVPYHRQLQSAHARLFTSMIQLLRATCDSSGLPVPVDLREWVEGSSEAE